MKPRFYPCDRSCVKEQIAVMTFHREICDRTMKQLLNAEGNLVQYLLIFFSKNKSSRWLTCCLCFCLPLFRTDFTESHCPLYLQLFKRIKNRDQIQVRRRHFQLLQIDLNCKRSVITTIMIISQLLWSQINHVGRLYSNAQIPRFTNISFHF